VALRVSPSGVPISIVVVPASTALPHPAGSVVVVGGVVLGGVMMVVAVAVVAGEADVVVGAATPSVEPHAAAANSTSAPSNSLIVARPSASRSVEFGQALPAHEEFGPRQGRPCGLSQRGSLVGATPSLE